ncbi:MAG: hypothetical protein ACQEWI_08730 [Bacillota bacterium]
MERGTICWQLQMQLNHAVVSEGLHRESQEEIKQVEKLLKEKGIGLPPTPPEPPHACLDNIATGASMPDSAIAAVLFLGTLMAWSDVSSQIQLPWFFGLFHHWGHWHGIMYIFRSRG